MRRLPALIAAAALLALAAGPAWAQGMQVTFNMPSGNVGCVFTPRGGTGVYMPEDGGPELACDRVEPNYVRVTLGARGPARIENDPGDASCCNQARILQYGEAVRLGPYTCESRESGLMCRRNDGRGFRVARGGVTVF